MLKVAHALHHRALDTVAYAYDTDCDGLCVLKVVFENVHQLRIHKLLQPQQLSELALYENISFVFFELQMDYKCVVGFEFVNLNLNYWPIFVMMQMTTTMTLMMMMMIMWMYD